MTFVQQLIKSRNNAICLIIAPVSGEKIAWYFIRVEPPKFAKFSQEVFKGGLKLSDYGEIIKRGYGEYPPQSIMDEMIEEYEYDPEN